MENEVTEFCKRRFLILEVLAKHLELCTNEILVRWGVTMQERVAGKLREKNEMRGALMRGNRSWEG